jgi:hypothetical protein
MLETMTWIYAILVIAACFVPWWLALTHKEEE